MLDTLKPEAGNYDSVVRDCFKKNKNTCISWFLLASYCYYLKDESILSDEVFDKMCKWMLDNHQHLEHEHKHLITKEMLGTGSGHSLKEVDYPNRVRYSAPVLIKQMYFLTGAASN